MSASLMRRWLSNESTATGPRTETNTMSTGKDSEAQKECGTPAPNVDRRKRKREQSNIVFETPDASKNEIDSAASKKGKKKKKPASRRKKRGRRGKQNVKREESKTDTKDISAAETGQVSDVGKTEKKANGQPGLSEYELQRLEHIKRNQEFMRRLGLLDVIEEKKESKASASSKRKPKIPLEPSRRSTRLRGIKPDYTGESIDRFGEEYDKAANRVKTVGRTPRWMSTEEVLTDSKKWLEESRAALLSLRTAEGTSPQSHDAWRGEAERRWGDKIPTSMDSWEDYVKSRIATPPPPSSLDLLQEYYAHDMWQLLVCCTLMSRVSSWKTKHNTISAFFAAYPTPSSVLDAEPNDVLKIIHPLGLFPTRMKSLVSVTQRFLEMPKFDVGLSKDLKIYGIGEFGFQSFLLFCRGDISIKPKDRALSSFAHWQCKYKKEMAEKKAADGEETGNKNVEDEQSDSSEEH